MGEILAKMDSPPRVLDLFCGMGGLAYGFAKLGFEIIGVDISRKAGLTYSYNRIGSFILMDLLKSGIIGRFDLIIGGPPCEPWSSLNLRRRKRSHPHYNCISAFFTELNKCRPIAFVMENVPALRKDPLFIKFMKKISKYYNTSVRIIKYSDYGAAFSRRRLFALGIRLVFLARYAILLSTPLARKNYF